MAQSKSKYRFDEKRGVVRAKFYELVEMGERPPELQLCTFEQLEFKLTERGSKRRTASEKFTHLSKLYLNRLRELQKEKKEKPKKTNAQTIKFSTLIELYKKDILPELSFSSQSAIANQLKYWNNTGGRRVLADINAPWIAQKRAELKKVKRTPATVNRYLAALSVVLSACVKEWHLIPFNPAQNVRKLKEPRGRTRYLTEKELKALLKAVSPRADLKLAVMLALTTGARRMEIWSLKRNDIDLQNGFATFSKTKTGVARTVPIRGESLELLRDYLARSESTLLFPGEKNPAVPFDFRRSFKAALVKAKIDDFSWHDLRHSAASYLIRSGVDLRIAGEILGHKNISMTMKYSHLAPDHLTEAVENMTKKFL
tara:strand:+ start:453 stop:1565 length:1113 start_codon:yes stop_codon:yes gene_type:complete